MRKAVMIPVMAVALLVVGSVAGTVAVVWGLTLGSSPLSTSMPGVDAPPTAKSEGLPPAGGGANSPEVLALPLVPPSDPRPLGGRVLRKMQRKRLAAPKVVAANLLASAWSEVQSRVASCMGGEALRGAGAPQAGGQTVILLDLELHHGVPRILDVSFAEGAEVGDDVLECAASALRGQVIASLGRNAPTWPGDDGTRVQIPFPLASAGTSVPIAAVGAKKRE